MAFQRVFGTGSRCGSNYLAKSPHLSTRAIHMNANNLRNCTLLRADSTRSTLRSPQTNRSAAGFSPRDTRRTLLSCSFFPAKPQQAHSSLLPAHRCGQTSRAVTSRVSGVRRMGSTTRGASRATAANSGFALSMRASRAPIPRAGRDSAPDPYLSELHADARGARVRCWRYCGRGCSALRAEPPTWASRSSCGVRR